MGGDDFLQDLREEWEVGDGPIVGVDVWVEGGFFKKGCNNGGFGSRIYIRTYIHIHNLNVLMVLQKAGLKSVVIGQDTTLPVIALPRG